MYTLWIHCDATVVIIILISINRGSHCNLPYWVRFLVASICGWALLFPPCGGLPLIFIIDVSDRGYFAGWVMIHHWMDPIT